MGEYIGKSAVVSALISIQNKYNRNRDHENVSAIVPVVRCKNCKYYSLCGRPPFMFYQCVRQGVTRSVEEDDFCKYGERSEL